MNGKTNSPFRTMLTISVGFLIIFLITNQKWALIVSLSVGLIGVFSTILSGYIDFLWAKLAWILSLIVPNIILSLFFFFFLFPIALLSKLFGKKDPMNLKNTKSSLFIDCIRKFDPVSFERTF